MNNKRMILSVGAILFLVSVFYFFFYANIQVNGPGDTSLSPNPPAPTDPFQILKDSNTDFRTGTELGRQKQYSEALVSFENAKTQAKTDSERSIIDFAISDTKFNIARNDGIDSFISVSKNTAYPERTRALAMTRAFLLYFKYEDTAMLGQLASAYDIPWTIPEEVTYQYMKKIVDLYPFALPRIWMIEYELNQVNDAPVAKQLYAAYRESIIGSIEDLMKWSGEKMELTSTMSAHARLLSRLSIQYDAVPASEVENSFQTLIDYGNVNGLTTNKQYTLLYYANFLSGSGNYEKAVLMVEMILKEGVDLAVAETLPRMDPQVRFPHFAELIPNTENEPVIAFIKSIGTKTN